MRIGQLAVLAFVAPDGATCFINNGRLQCRRREYPVVVKKDSATFSDTSESRLNSVSSVGQQAGDELFPRQPSRSPFPLSQERQRRSNEHEMRGWKQQRYLQQPREDARAQESRFSLATRLREEKFRRAVNKGFEMDEETRRLAKEVAIAEFQVGRALARLQTLEQQIRRDKEIARSRITQQRKVYKSTNRGPYKYRGENPKARQTRNMLAGSAVVAGAVAVGLANGEYIDQQDMQMVFSTARSAATSISTDASKVLDKAAAELAGMMDPMDRDAVSLAARRLTKAALNLETSIAASSAFVVDSAAGELSSIMTPRTKIDESALSSAATKLTKMAVEVETSVATASERLLDKAWDHDSPTVSQAKVPQGSTFRTEEISPIRLDDGSKKNGQEISIADEKVEVKAVNSNEKVPSNIAPTTEMVLSKSIDDHIANNRGTPISTLEVGPTESLNDQKLANDKLDTRSSSHASEKPAPSIEEAMKSSPATVAAMLSSFSYGAADGSYLDTLELLDETTEAQWENPSVVDWGNDNQVTVSPGVEEVEPQQILFLDPQRYAVDGVTDTDQTLEHTADGVENGWTAEAELSTDEAQFYMESESYLASERSAAFESAVPGPAEERQVNYQGELPDMINSDHMESSTFLFLDPHKLPSKEEVVTDTGFHSYEAATTGFHSYEAATTGFQSYEAATTTFPEHELSVGSQEYQDEQLYGKVYHLVEPELRDDKLGLPTGRSEASSSFPEHELSVGYQEYQDEQLYDNAYHLVEPELRDDKSELPTESSEASSSFLFLDPRDYSTSRAFTEESQLSHVVGSETSGSRGFLGLETSHDGFSSEVLASSESLHFQNEDDTEEMSQNTLMFLGPQLLVKDEARERGSSNIDSVDTPSMSPVQFTSAPKDDFQARSAAAPIVSVEREHDHNDEEASIPNSFLFVHPLEVVDEVRTEEQFGAIGEEELSAPLMVDAASPYPEEMQVQYEDKWTSSGTWEGKSESQVENPIQDESNAFLFLDPEWLSLHKGSSKD